MAGAVMAEDAGPLVRFHRWCGMALVVAGPLIVIATLYTPAVRRLRRSLPASRRWSRRMWFTRLLGCWCCSGTYLIAVTGNFGFLAPVLAKQSLAVLDAVNQYTPVLIVNGLAAILFMIGYVLFGIAMIRTATMPRWSGVLVAVALGPFTGTWDGPAGLGRRREPARHCSPRTG